MLDDMAGAGVAEHQNPSLSRTRRLREPPLSSVSVNGESAMVSIKRRVTELWCVTAGALLGIVFGMALARPIIIGHMLYDFESIRSKISQLL